MIHLIERPMRLAVFAFALALTGLQFATAQEVADAPLAPPSDAAAFGPVSAETIDIAALLYNRRPVIVFANSPNDPNFLRQMDLLPRVFEQLALRDVILITDTDPQAMSDLRKRLRPNGFSLVLMDKDWRSATRKPLPWDGREIVNAIDRMPLARAEGLARNPSGR